ncbi:MAG: hypothetical protein IJM90_06545 [Firmicutes bacterium]|nr:hypothetical protein [Bacillota bacterium]
MKKIPTKSWILSAILLIIGVIHIFYGYMKGQFEWLWIILCFGGAILNILAEIYLVPRVAETIPDDEPEVTITEEELTAEMEAAKAEAELEEEQHADH